MAVTAATLRQGRAWLDPIKYDDIIDKMIVEAKLCLDEEVLGVQYDRAVEHMAMGLLLAEQYFREKRLSVADGSEHHADALARITAVAGTAYRILP